MQKKLATTGIPTYRANGRRVSDSSLERVERLVAMGMMSVRRNKRGRITIAQFIAEAAGADPIHKTAHMGQRYSFMSRVGETARAWQHKQMYQLSGPLELDGISAEERADVDRYLRSVFLAVPLSCIKVPEPPKPPKAPAKIIEFPKPTVDAKATPKREALMRLARGEREAA